MYTVLLLIDIYLPVKFLVDTSYISVLCSAQYICKFSEITGPTEAFHVTPPWERRKGGKIIQNDLGHLLIVIIVYQGRGHLAGILPQIWPRNAGLLAELLKFESKKKTLFPGPDGVGDTNDWRITEPLNVQTP